MEVCLLSQSAPEKHNQEKKKAHTFVHLVNLFMFDNHTILLFWL